MTSTPSVAQLADGRHTLRVSAVDAAGNVGYAARATSMWTTRPRIPWSRDRRRRRLATHKRLLSVVDDQPNSAAPIARAHWKLCLARWELSCPRRRLDRQDVHELADLHVPHPAITGCTFGWRTQRATSERQTPPSRCRSASTLSRRICLSPCRIPRIPSESRSTSPTGIPGSLGERSRCEPPGATTWHGLRTDREGSQLVAYVDDERFRNGLYEFRAHAEDQAGNEASTATRADGATASLRLPARIDTRLAVGVPLANTQQAQSFRTQHLGAIRSQSSTERPPDQRRRSADRGRLDRGA